MMRSLERTGERVFYCVDGGVCVRTILGRWVEVGGDRAVDLDLDWIGGVFDIPLLISFPLSFNLSFFFSLCLEGRRKKKKKKKKKGNKSILY